MNESVRRSAGREYLSGVRDSLVKPAAASFSRAHRVSPAVLRVVTYPLAALATLVAWIFALTVLAVILGVIAVVTWLSGGYATGSKDPRKRQAEARETIRLAKEQRQAGRRG